LGIDYDLFGTPLVHPDGAKTVVSGGRTHLIRNSGVINIIPAEVLLDMTIVANIICGAWGTLQW
jgi:hypothetical protein